MSCAIQWVSLLRRCKSLKEVRDLDALICTGMASVGDLQVANTMVATYARLGSLEEARKVYDGIGRKNSYSLHCMLKSYLEVSRWTEAKQLFDEWPGRPDVFSCTTMVTFYSSQPCSSILLARGAFERAATIDAALCNAMLSCYTHNDALEAAAAFFRQMPQRDVTSFNTMLLGYAEKWQVHEAGMLFGVMPVRNSFSWTTMVAVYSDCGQLAVAKHCFDCMPERDVVAGNIMIKAFASTGHYPEASEVARKMPQLSVVSWTTLLAGYAERGHVASAKELFNSMPEKDVVAWTAVMAASAQSGQYLSAESCFSRMPQRTLVSWNALLTAYSQAGRLDDAYRLVASMLVNGIPLDAASFSGLLAACSHGGNVEQGVKCFISIRADHGIEPSKEHYCCVIDLLGRAGHLLEAEELVLSMPFSDNADAWQALLGASRHKDTRLAEAAARRATRLGSVDPAPYNFLARVNRSSSLTEG